MELAGCGLIDYEGRFGAIAEGNSHAPNALQFSAGRALNCNAFFATLAAVNSEMSVPTENDCLHSGLLIPSQICLFIQNWEYQ